LRVKPDTESDAPMSYFTEEALKKFQELCAAGLNFAEGEEYDFVQCLMANGDIYGVEPGEACEKGKQISDKQAAALRAKGAKKDSPEVRMAKLKKAFLKKTGREMTKEEAAKASWLVNKGK
jgi:hypothetical protein